MSRFVWLKPCWKQGLFFFFFCNGHFIFQGYRSQGSSPQNIHSRTQVVLPPQLREVMKTNGRVLFPLGPKEELSHQANFILVWPRDSISSGCFYKRRAAPRHRPVMDMRAWWPDGRCWLCNSRPKHSLMTPLAPCMFLTEYSLTASECIYRRLFDFLKRSVVQ